MSTVDKECRERLQRLLDNPMMQQNDSSWTRQRQRAYIKSRIEALGGAFIGHRISNSTRFLFDVEVGE